MYYFSHVNQYSKPVLNGVQHRIETNAFANNTSHPKLHTPYPTLTNPMVLDTTPVAGHIPFDPLPTILHMAMSVNRKPMVIMEPCHTSSNTLVHTVMVPRVGRPT